MSDNTKAFASHPIPVIASMCAAVVLIIAAVAALSPVLSTIGADLQPTQSELQWIVDAFAITLAALLLPMGALGDRFGRRRVMLGGFAVFVGAAVWGATAGDVTSLIASRAVGGIGAAMIFPGTLATLTATMPSNRRGLAIGLWTASASLGGTIGMIVAGGLVEFFAYTSVFVALAVGGAAVGAMTLAFVPETSDAAHASLDVVGAIISVVALGALVFGIIEAPIRGWTDASTIIAFAVGAVGLAVFVLWETRVSAPLFDVRLFRLRGFSTGTALVFVQFLVVFGYFFAAAQFLGFARSYSPFEIAAALLPVGVLLPVLSIKAPAWSNRFGRGYVGALGLLLMAIATAAFAFMDATTAYWVFALALVLFGAGMGLSGPPGTEAIVEALPPEKQGVASAVNDVSRELGGALGIALIGSALASGYRDAIDASVAIPADVLAGVRESAAAGIAIAASGGPTGTAIGDAVRAALSDGFSVAMLVSTAILLVGAIYVALRTPKSPASTAAEADARSTVGMSTGDA